MEENLKSLKNKKDIMAIGEYNAGIHVSLRKS
jgi:hypothetical protein